MPVLWFSRLSSGMTRHWGNNQQFPMRFAGWPSPPPSRRPVADQLAQVACLQVVVPVMVQAFVGMLVLVQALVPALVPV